MKPADLAARTHFEADVDSPDAEKAHALIHIVVPPGTDGIRDSFAITTQRCCLGGNGGASAVGDIPTNYRLARLGLVTL